MTIFEQDTLVRGSGGGGKDGGSGGRATEDPNTLQSKATARLIDLLGEGPIKGLCAEAQSIYFNDTPLLGPGGYNFKGVQWEFRYGQPGLQPHINGFAAAETEVSVGAEVKHDQPIVRTVSDPSVDAVRVAVTVAGLNETDTGSGDMHGSKVAIEIHVRSNGGNWELKASDTIEGKTTSAYERAYRIELTGTAPWDIKVSRPTPDSDKVAVQNKTTFSHYAEIIDGKFSYPDSALIALQVDAQQFGNQIPTRSYDVYGLILQVPSNYDPETRIYAGVWDGGFKPAWTDNPAWVLYDLLTNTRYGLGDAIGQGQVDKWSLYQIAQYCDQKIPSGRKDEHGVDITEPRYTFNGVIAGREDAYKVIQAIASVLRGMAFWAAGSVFARSDMPSDPVKLVSPANVIDGSFTYSGTALKARHTVAMVQWNDPEDGYRKAVEVVEDADSIARWGWRPIEITAFGCVRRSQANRMGRWILDSEKHETETVKYRASFDHADVTPGDIVSLADPSYANARFGGRLALVTGAEVTVDAPVILEAGQSYTLSVVLPDGSIQSRRVVPSSLGEHVALPLESAFSPPPEPGAMWSLSASNLAPRLFRVRAVRETEKNVFEVTALRHDPNKFARIENGLVLPEPPTVRPTEGIPDPANFVGQETRYQRNDVPRARVSLSWTAPDYPYLTGYRLSITAPSGAVETINTAATAYDIVDAEIGTYRFRLVTVAWNGSTSRGVTLELKTAGWEEIPGLYVSHLEVDGQGTDTNFVTRDPVFTWRGNFPDTSWQMTSEPAAGAGRIDPRFRDYVVRVFDPATKALLRTEYTTAPKFVYTLEMNRQDSAALARGSARRRIRIAVAIRDKLWRESRQTVLDVYNPPLPVPRKLHVTSGIGVILVTFDLPTENDFAGTLVWRGQSPDFLTDADHLVAQGRDNSYVIPGDPNLGYYIRVAHYDVFGLDEAEVSSPIFVEAAFIVDSEPPPRPAAPTLTTFMGEDGKARLKADFTASPARDFSTFEIAAKRSDDDLDQWQFTQTDQLVHVWIVDQNTSYDVKLRAHDTSSNRSPYSEIVTIVSAKDSTPPAPVTELAADASFKSVWLSWQNPADADLSHVEIWEGADEDREAATRLGVQPSTPATRGVTTRSGLEPGDVRHYWVRPVDQAGNAGEWTGPVRIETGSLKLPDFPDDFGPIPLVATLPPGGPGGGVKYAFLTGDQKLYKWDGSAWKPAFSFAEIEGQIKATQIGDESISAPKIAAGAITTAKLAAGSVTADQIAANAITAGKIAAGAITADKIAATQIITNRAQIANAVIDSAHISELDAGKIRAGTVMSGSVVVNGQQIGDLATAVGDPAAKINQGSTRIDPGRIVISGGTTLADWRSGPNSTEINGGVIGANTIAANKLSIGARGITIDGLEFMADRHSGTCSWTWGTVRWVDDGGNLRHTAVAGYGNAPDYNGNGGSGVGPGLIFWQKGNDGLNWTSDPDVLKGSDKVHIATYHGGSLVVANYGGTRIDGERLVAGSVIAHVIQAGAIKAHHVETNSLTAVHLKSNEVIIENKEQLGLRVIGSAQIDNLAVDRAHIRDLTINGQKIEDYATGNMVAAQGEGSAAVGIETRGKPILILACRGYQKPVARVVDDGHESYYTVTDWVWEWFSANYYEHPGPGWHVRETSNVTAPAGSINFFSCIAIIELRK